MRYWRAKRPQERGCGRSGEKTTLPAPKYVVAIGIGCSALIAVSLIPAIVMGCLPAALRLGTCSLLIGALLGAMMAAVTRTRSPGLIYLCLLVGMATLWALYHPWPEISVHDIVTAHGSVNNVVTYLQSVRPLLFLLGVPFPYAWLGRHSADPVPESAEQS